MYPAFNNFSLKEQTRLSKNREKILTEIKANVKTLSDLKPDFQDLEIEIVKEILDYRNIEYDSS